MLHNLDYLLARPANLLKCPLTTEEQAEIWNSFQDQEGVRALRILQGIKSKPSMSRHTSNQVSFTFASDLNTHRPPMEISFSTRNGSGWNPDSNEIFIRFETPIVPWEQFIDRLGPRAGEFVNWMEDVVVINEKMAHARATFKKVIEVCSTIGQLCRIVPECNRFVSAGKMGKLEEQKKRSPLPEEWYSMDPVALDQMNNFLTQCQLMPVSESDKHNEAGNIYNYITWVKVRTRD